MFDQCVKLGSKGEITGNLWNGIIQNHAGISIDTLTEIQTQIRYAINKISIYLFIKPSNSLYKNNREGNGIFFFETLHELHLEAIERQTDSTYS